MLIGEEDSPSSAELAEEATSRTAAGGHLCHPHTGGSSSRICGLGSPRHPRRRGPLTALVALYVF
jgi:hypothetical protein